MSTVKVNTVDKRTGGTLTLGGCGTTVTLGAGATQSGFGRTGTVDWCTTAKTAPFTGVSGNGYFVNTTSGVVTVTLPATPSAGDIISIADYASTFQTNNLTICRNSSKINGVCGNSILNTEGQSITLVYVDGTRGWKNTMDSTSNVSGTPNFITATGGTITCCGDYRIHTFTSDGCFSIASAPTPTNNYVDYLVVAGGGGSGNGGGGAGGYRESYCATTSGCYTASPLASATSLPVSVTAYPITVGAGGVGPSAATPGADSIFSSITSTGGGAGAGTPFSTPTAYGASGGSGGGATQGASTPAPTRPAQGGTGNTPPVSPSQGFTGGNTINGDNTGSGGGGGATAAGGNATGPTSGSPGTDGIGGPGGNGAGTAINNIAPVGTPGPSPSLRYFAGGGGGNQYSPAAPAVTTPGGYGGGGTGSHYSIPGSADTGATDGTANTGGGAGGTAGGCKKNGGSGIVIIRYKYQ
jgi:hypothetical protein